MMFDEEIRIEITPAGLPGHVTMPDEATGLVIFAHGSGSSRLSPRNRYVAGALNDRGVGTLLFDLLSPLEAADRANVFDIGLLARRLEETRAWVMSWGDVGSLPVAYFGASTGAAAALVAAAEGEGEIATVISRGGRPDLAGRHLGRVRCPTLLVVGGNDPVVLELNREALTHLTPSSHLEVVPGATHLFEEPGALERVADLAADWLTSHL